MSSIIGRPTSGYQPLFYEPEIAPAFEKANRKVVMKVRGHESPTTIPFGESFHLQVDLKNFTPGDVVFISVRDNYGQERFPLSSQLIDAQGEATLLVLVKNDQTTPAAWNIRAIVSEGAGPRTAAVSAISEFVQIILPVKVLTQKEQVQEFVQRNCKFEAFVHFSRALETTLLAPDPTPDPGLLQRIFDTIRAMRNWYFRHLSTAFDAEAVMGEHIEAGILHTEDGDLSLEFFWNLDLCEGLSIPHRVTFRSADSSVTAIVGDTTLTFTFKEIDKVPLMLVSPEDVDDHKQENF